MWVTPCRPGPPEVLAFSSTTLFITQKSQLTMTRFHGEINGFKYLPLSCPRPTPPQRGRCTLDAAQSRVPVPRALVPRLAWGEGTRLYAMLPWT